MSYWIGMSVGAALAALSHSAQIASDAPRNWSVHHKQIDPFVMPSCNNTQCKDA